MLSRGSRRLALGVAAALLFVAAVGLSWSEGGTHLDLQAAAMVIGLAAFGLAALAARPAGDRRP